MRIGSVLLAIGVLLLAGCFNRYTRIDDQGLGFMGIDQHIAEANGSLHVLQIHGMGDHPHEAYCSDGTEGREKSINIALQDKIAAQLGYELEWSSGVEKILVGKTPMGEYSARRFVNPRDANAALLFSCVVWGDASRSIKLEMLQLHDDFYEKSDNELHRAPLNRQAKRFVNRSFSDPMIYAGTFGSMIRRAVWQGIQDSAASHAQQQRLASPDTDTENGVHASSASLALSFFRSFDTVVISDSLGSRVMFDTFCAFGANCSKPESDESIAETRGTSVVTPTATAEALHVIALAGQVSASVKGMYMFANQLPLIELAYIPAPADSVALMDVLHSSACFQPIGEMLPRLGGFPEKPVTIVAFTDANDALSYDLGGKFTDRCAPQGSGLRIVNVVLPNAWPRWLGAYTSLGKAHASGFKKNDKAISYLVRGKRRVGE